MIDPVGALLSMVEARGLFSLGRSHIRTKEYKDNAFRAGVVLKVWMNIKQYICE